MTLFIFKAFCLIRFFLIRAGLTNKVITNSGWYLEYCSKDTAKCIETNILNIYLISVLCPNFYIIDLLHKEIDFQWGVIGDTFRVFCRGTMHRINPKTN